MLTRLNEIKSKGDGFFTSSVSNRIIILFLFYACSQCNAHIEDLFTLSFQLSAVRCGTNLERESTHHLPSGLAGAGVAQRNATQRNGYALKLRVPAFLCKNEKHVPAFGYIIKRSSRLQTSGQGIKQQRKSQTKSPALGLETGKRRR